MGPVHTERRIQSSTYHSQCGEKPCGAPTCSSQLQLSRGYDRKKRVPVVCRPPPDCWVRTCGGRGGSGLGLHFICFLLDGELEVRYESPCTAQTWSWPSRLNPAIWRGRAAMWQRGFLSPPPPSLLRAAARSCSKGLPCPGFCYAGNWGWGNGTRPPAM